MSKRKEDYMWTSAFILAHFMRFVENTLITRRDLLNYGTQDAIDSALKRLIKKKIIVRVAWGVYVRPLRGQPIPAPEDVAAVKIAAFHRTQMSTGRDVAREHNLTQEGETDQIYEVDGATSSFALLTEEGEELDRVFLRRKVARKMQLEASPVRRAIKALWTVGPELVTEHLIQQALIDLNREQRRELRLSHRWMPGWLSDMIHRFGGLRELVALSQ